MVASRGRDRWRTRSLPRDEAGRRWRVWCHSVGWHPMSMHGSHRDSASNVDGSPWDCQWYPGHRHEGGRGKVAWNDRGKAHECLSRPHPRWHAKRLGWKWHAWKRTPWHPRFRFAKGRLVEPILIARRGSCCSDGPHDSILVDLHHHRLHLHGRCACGRPRCRSSCPSGPVPMRTSSRGRLRRRGASRGRHSRHGHGPWHHPRRSKGSGEPREESRCEGHVGGLDSDRHWL